MSLRTASLAACCAMVAAHGAVPATAAPLWIEGGLSIDMRGAVALVDEDLQRQGYVTAFRAASLRSAIQGRGRPRAPAMAGFVSTLNPPQISGWTVSSAVATAGVFAPLIGGVVPSSRSDAPSGANTTLVSSFNVGELGRLDDGSRAVQRVIEGARTFSETDDIAAMLSSAP